MTRFILTCLAAGAFMTGCKCVAGAFTGAKADAADLSSAATALGKRIDAMATPPNDPTASLNLERAFGPPKTYSPVTQLAK